MFTHQYMNTKWIHALLIILVAIGFSSCYTQRDKSLWQDSKSFPKYAKADYEQYKIHVNDELIFREQVPMRILYDLSMLVLRLHSNREFHTGYIRMAPLICLLLTL